MGTQRADYWQAIADVPVPSDTQADAFVEYVFRAHSWYKHLPLFPPGASFVFFVDPNAGRERVSGAYRDRMPDTPARERFHYTWQPTRDYLSKYGHLQYHTDRGTSFLVPMSGGTLDTSLALSVCNLAGLEVEVPAAVTAAGSVELTATIHPMCESPLIWRRGAGLEWPFRNELPSSEPADPIHGAMWRFLQSAPPLPVQSSPGPVTDPAWRAFLDDLVRPDLLRQRQAARRAIGSMLDVVRGGSAQ